MSVSGPCPVCNLPVMLERHYTDGSSMYVHAEHEGLFGFMEVDDACYEKSNNGGGVIMEDQSSKSCSLCQIEKVRADFPRDRQKSDGFSSWCKPCSKFRSENPGLSIAEVKVTRQGNDNIGVTAYALALANKSLAQAAEKASQVESPPFAPPKPTAASLASEKASRKRPPLTRAQKDARNEKRRLARRS